MDLLSPKVVATPPTRRALDRIGDRWTVLVVGSLSNDPLLRIELEHRVDLTSQKMLTQKRRGSIAMAC